VVRSIPYSVKICRGQSDSFIGSNFYENDAYMIDTSTKQWNRQRSLILRWQLTTVQIVTTAIVSRPTWNEKVQQNNRSSCKAHMTLLYHIKPCPHCRRKVRLSPNSATVTVFCDSRTFLQQYGQGFSGYIQQCATNNTQFTDSWC